MPRGDAERIRRYLCDQVASARGRGEKTITFRAGDIHDSLGLRKSHANVCQVLDRPKFRAAARVEFVRDIERPPSGEGANLVVEFRIL